MKKHECTKLDTFILKNNYFVNFFKKMLILEGFMAYTATLFSRNASFKDVFKSVLSLRVPIIKAQFT